MANLLEDLESISRLNLALSSASNLQETLNIIVSECSRIMKAKGCLIRLLDEKRQELLWSSAFGLSEGYAKKGAVQLKESSLDCDVINGSIIQSRDICNDLRVHYPEEMRQEGIVSALLLPIPAYGRNRGILRIYTGEPRDFSKEDVEKAKIIAVQGGYAIDKTILNEEIRTLLSISQQISVSLKLDDVLAAIVHGASDTLGFKAASIRLLDETGSMLELKAAHNLSPDYINKGPVLLAQSPIDRRVLNGETVVCGAQQQEHQQCYIEDIKREGIETTLSLPLTIHRKAIGVLRIYMSTIYIINRSEADFLTALANQCAIAIENARLFEHLQRDYDDLTRDVWNWYEWGAHAPKI